jgi:hypothetical protein
MAEANALLRWHDFHQVRFDFVGIRVVGKSQALGNAHDMGIDADGLPAEGIAENDVGRLTSYARQREEIVDAVRDLPAEACDQLLAAAVNRFGFVAIKINFSDLDLQFGRCSASVIGGRTVGLEKFRRNLVDQIVARLSCEDQRDQELQRVFVIEIELGVGMGILKPLDDFDYPGVIRRAGLFICARRDHFSFYSKYASKKPTTKGGKISMDASALTTVKQNIRKLKKEKSEIRTSSKDRKKIKKIQRQVKLLKRESRVLAKQKKAEAAAAAAAVEAKAAAEKAAAAKAAESA